MQKSKMFLMKQTAAQFIGRGNTIHDPEALINNQMAFQVNQGSVLDPIVSIRYRIFIEPMNQSRLIWYLELQKQRDL